MFLRIFLKKNITIKPIYKDINEFIDILAPCDEITFTHITDLFNQDSSISASLKNLVGVDSPEIFTILARYNKHLISNFLRRLDNSHKNNEIRGLIIKGKDEQGFDTIFKTERFTRKIDIL